MVTVLPTLLYCARRHNLLYSTEYIFYSKICNVQSTYFTVKYVICALLPVSELLSLETEPESFPNVHHPIEEVESGVWIHK